MENKVNRRAECGGGLAKVYQCKQRLRKCHTAPFHRIIFQIFLFNPTLSNASGQSQRPFKSIDRAQGKAPHYGWRILFLYIRAEIVGELLGAP